MQQRVCFRGGCFALTLGLAFVLLILLNGSTATSSGSNGTPVGETSGRSVPVAGTLSSQSPGIAVCSYGTIRDLQHLAAGQKQIAVSGDPDDGTVHFTWWQNSSIPLPGVDPAPESDFAQVNCYDSESQYLIMADCGQILPGWTVGTTSFPNLALQPSQGTALFAYSDVTSSSDVYVEEEYFSPCSGIYGSLLDWPNASYPHITSHQVLADDVSHLVGWNGGWEDSTGQMLYWRRIGPHPASWSGPGTLDVEDGFNHHITASPVSGKVAIVYIKEVAGIREVFVMESATNGDDWLAGSFTPTQITEY